MARQIATEKSDKELLERLAVQFKLRIELIEFIIQSQKDGFTKAFFEKDFVLLKGVGKFALKNVSGRERKAYPKRSISKLQMFTGVGRLLEGLNTKETGQGDNNAANEGSKNNGGLE